MIYLAGLAFISYIFICTAIIAGTVELHIQGRVKIYYILPAMCLELYLLVVVPVIYLSVKLFIPA